MTIKLVCRTVKLQEPPDLLSIVPEIGGFAWLAPGTSLVGLGQVQSIEPGAGEGRFQRAVARLEGLFGRAEVEDSVDLPGTGPVAFGSFTFDPQNARSKLIVPSEIYGIGDGVAWHTVLWDGANGNPPGPSLAAGTPQYEEAPADTSGHAGVVQDSLTRQCWTELVQTLQEAISEGRVEKVVLARRLNLEFADDIRRARVLRRLSAGYPGCFTFAFGDLVGASPELLVRRLGEVVDSIPLAGSAPRGRDEAEDETLGATLMASAKDRHEHRLTVDSVLEELKPFCSQISSESEPSLLTLANLQHLSTKVQGKLHSPAGALELVEALHPTAAVCGVPREEAMHQIRSLEGFERGGYAGPVGWVDHRGDGEWAVALRCAELRGRTARIYAGAGILAGSDPVSEWEETELKLQAVLSALE